MNYKQTINSFSAWTVDRLISVRRATLTMLATFLISMTAQTAWAQDPATIGSISYNSELGAYEIKSVDNLHDLAVYVNGSGDYSTGGSETISHDCSGLTFKMTDNIDYEPSESTTDNYTPIAANNVAFRGHFDGNDKTISGIRIYSGYTMGSESQNKGIFGDIYYPAEVKNVTLANTRITAGTHAGGIVGTNNGGIIDNCHVTSTVTIIANNSSSASIHGGIVGYNYINSVGEGQKGTVSNCISEATLSFCVSDVGGIAGRNDAELSGNFVIGATIPAGSGADKSYGAIVGKNRNGELTNNYYSACTVGGVKNATNVGVGTDNSGTPVGDVTTNNGAVVDEWGLRDGNDGSAEKPYVITTTAGLDLLAQRVNAGSDAVANGFSGKYFKLGDNIAYDKNTANNFTPIGDISHIFYGTFDGDGKTISGININSGSAECQAIFGFVNGTVKNLVVSNCSIVGRHNIGAIAGKLRSGTIENCRVENNVALSGKMYVGGIVGNCEGGTIKGCTSAATITGIKYSGNNAEYLGGIVGATTTSNPSTLTDNIFTGAITGDLGKYIGAIVGQNNSGTLTNNVYTSTGFGGIVAEGSTTSADDAGARKALTISAADGVTITPTGTATTYDVSGITVYADNSGLGYASKFYAGATDAVKLSIANTGTPETGYEFSGFTAGEGVTITSSENVYTLTVPASDVTVDVVNQAIIYNITYKGVEDEGVTFTEDNPEAYTVADESFTLNNPSKEDYVFTGWTYEGQTTPTTSVTIATGSTGDKTFTANWRSMEEPNPAVVNVEETPVAIGGEVYYQPTEDVKQIFKGDNASFAISAEASNRMEVTAEGSVKFSKGPSTTIALPKLTVGAKMRVDFYGQVKVKDTEVRRNSIYTRGRGDSSSDGMIDLVSGAEYEVLKDGDLVLTIVLEEEEVVLEGISVTEPEPSDGSIVVTAKNKYWTFSSDKDVKVPAGVKVYTCQLNSDQTAVVITNITSTLGGVIKAGNGVLLSSAPGDYVFVPSTETASETKTYENNLLEPVLKATNFASGEYYVLKDNEFHPILANDSNVPANKAVLRVAKKSAARLEIIGDDDVKTAINGIAVEEDGAEWYTISGQRIDKPTKKGLYIKNGKKVIIK